MLRGSNGRGTVNGSRKTGSSAKKVRARESCVVVGRLVRLDEAGVEVQHPGNHHGPVPARSTVPLAENQVGQEVALMFEDGNPDRPIIVGVLQAALVSRPEAKPIRAKVDAETLTIIAEKEIVLECGQASIILTRDGKIQPRGTYLLSRSSGVNRIQGGSVELN